MLLFMKWLAINGSWGATRQVYRKLIVKSSRLLKMLDFVMPTMKTTFCCIPTERTRVSCASLRF